MARVMSGPFVRFLRTVLAIVAESLLHPLSTSVIDFDDDGHLTVRRTPSRGDSDPM